jgi:hypothetical protein
LSPTLGVVGAGTVFTVTGTNFLSEVSSSTCAAVTRLGATTLQCAVPSSYVSSVFPVTLSNNGVDLVTAALGLIMKSA